MRRTFLAFVLLLAAAAPRTLSAYVLGCDGGGALSRGTYVSGVTNQERPYTVYLPGCYHDLQRSYPLLTLLHGSDADDSQWPRIGFFAAYESALRAGSAPPLIVLMPYGGAAANQNRFDAFSYDAILLDFLQQMNERYRSSGAQAIGGISRGGFWAYQLGFSRPEEFVAIGGHSPYFDADHVAAAYNPLNLAEALPADTRLKLWLDRGAADYAALGVEQMHVKLKHAKAPHEYRVYADGEHSEQSWTRHVADYVSFYADAFTPPEAAPAARAEQVVDEVELWLPAVGFGALMTSIDSAQLEATLAGALDDRLILSETYAERLVTRGVDFHADTRIVADNQLFYALWRDKNSYTLLPFDRLSLRLRPLWVDDVAVVDQLSSYPLVFDEGAANYSPDKLTRITLSGTTALARHTLTALDARGLEWAASGIQDYVLRSDYFQVTHEASISATCPDPAADSLDAYSSICMKREHARLFERLDVDIVDLTGNHINDFGYEAFVNTLDVFEARGQATVGGGRSRDEARTPLLIEHNGSRIGWLACNAIGPPYAFANDDPDLPFGQRPGVAYCHGDPWLRDALAILGARADIVLLTVQYREFDGFQPLQRHLDDYRMFAEWGADVVVGTAEHKPMTFEFYQTRRGETAFIHFGLGNLFFDQLPWGNRRFFLDTLYVYAGQLLTVELFPGIIDDRARPRLLSGEDLFNFLHFMFIQKNEF